MSRRTFLGWAAAAGLSGCAANKLTDGPASSTVGTESTSAGTTVATADSTVAAITAATTAATTATTSASPASTAAASSASSLVAGGPASFINHGPRNSGAVALTFHAAGDIGRANALLDLLKRSGTPVTIFAVGSWLDANPQIAKRILADGHELSNHTWSHGAMRSMGAGELQSEISKAAAAIARSTGTSSNGRWFRPSQIEVPTPEILAAAGKSGYPVSVGYDLDSLDFQDPGAAAVKANVIGHVQGGNIVSLHFDHQNTIEALPAIIDHLKSKTLKPVTVSQLIG